MSVTLADLLGPEAAPIEFDHDGETYRVGVIDQTGETRILNYLRKKAHEELYAEKHLMPPDMYEDRLAVLAQEKSKYGFLKAVFWKSMADPERMPGLIATILQTTEKKAAKLLEDRGAETVSLVMETIFASIPREQAELMRKQLRARASAIPPATADPTAPG